MPTTAPSADAILSDLQKSINDLQARARAHIDSLDNRIRELCAQQSALKIPRAAFVAKIVDDIRQSAAGDAALTEQRAKQASFPQAHFHMRQLNAIDRDGKPDFVTRTPKPLNILDWESRPLALVGVLSELFEPAITAWAEQLADSLELPTTGSIDAVHEQFDALQTEIEALSGEREKAKVQLSELVKVRASPFVDQDTYLRMRGERPPVFQPVQEDPLRPAGVYDANGHPAGTIGGDAWNAYWAKRRTDDAAEEAREAEENL